jgi:glycogen(starch) synthase
VRIALLADEDPGWGGIGTYTGILGRSLQALGHDVQLVLRGWGESRQESLDGLPVHRVTVPQPSWRRGTVALVSRLYTTRESLVFSARAAAVLARIGAEVVEAPEFHAPGLLAALRARLVRRAPRVVVRLHGPSWLTAELAGENRDVDLVATELVEAAAVHAAHGLSAPSWALTELVRTRWRLPEQRLRIVPNPIDDDLFTPAAADAAQPGRILVVGRLERAKGQDMLLEALPAVRERVPDAHLRLVGDDGGMAAQLSSRAASLGVPHAVVQAGARPRTELPAEYRAAAVCAVPSRFESFPYSCLEAMSCGRAVVASRAGGLTEAVRDEEDGLLVDSEDPAALAAALTRLLLDSSERRRLGQAARDRVLAAFASRAVALRMADLYGAVAR